MTDGCSNCASAALNDVFGESIIYPCFFCKKIICKNCYTKHTLTCQKKKFGKYFDSVCENLA